MNDNTTQTVVESPPLAPPSGTNEGARNQADDLESLLTEYEREVVASPPSPPEPPPQPPPLSDERVRRLEQRLFDDEIKTTVNTIVGDMKIPYRLAVGWLDQMARENPKITAAFMNKSTDQRTWKRIETVLREEMRKEFDSFRVDEDATADKAAVAAAVRGASTKVPNDPPPSFKNMSNAEYRKVVYEKYGFDPGV